MIKRHWLLLLGIAIFLWAVWHASKKAAIVASLAVGLASFLFAPASLFLKLIYWAIGLYVSNFVYGFIPGSDTWYQWLPRPAGFGKLNASVSNN